MRREARLTVGPWLELAGYAVTCTRQLTVLPSRRLLVKTAADSLVAGRNATFRDARHVTLLVANVAVLTFFLTLLGLTLAP